MRLTDYALVLQAAQTGDSFAFGWGHIVRDLIDRKLLAARDLVWSKTKPLSENASRVRDWILSYL